MGNRQAAVARIPSLCLHALLVSTVFGFPIGFGSAPASADTPSGGPYACPSTVGTKKSFKNQSLVDHNFSADPARSLVGADFTGADLRGAVFAGQDLTDASFSGANLGVDTAGNQADFTNTTVTNTCFIGATLIQTDFSYANITCADFSGAKIYNGSFGPTQNIIQGQGCRTSFKGAQLDPALITQDGSGKDNWSKVDFSYAIFQSQGAQPFSLAGRDITGAILVGVSTLPKLNMTGANLTNVDFSSARLDGAVFDHAALNGAILDNVRAENASFKCAQAYGTNAGQTLQDGSKCTQAPTSINTTTAASFISADLQFGNFEGAMLDFAILQGANLNQSKFDGASLKSANFQGGAPARGGGGTVQSAIVSASTFRKAKLNTNNLTSVNFTNNDLTSADFSQSTLLRTTFTGATLSGADFSNTILQDVQFTSTNLTSVNFLGSTMQAAATQGSNGPNFNCARMGGTNFSNAKVSQTNFLNAVMPLAEDCKCPGADPAKPLVCGIDAATQSTYGPVTLPVLDAGSNNICPNGTPSPCQTANWRLSKDWSTTACGSIPQPMWSKSCGGAGGDIVDIPDAALKACILQTLPNQTEVLLATAQTIGEVACAGKGISNITGLEKFLSLHSLDLGYNQLADFKLTFQDGKGNTVPSQLTKLVLSGNKLTNLSLAGHPQIIILDISNNSLSNFSLDANTNLSALNASRNALSAFDLPSQNTLTTVDLSYNKISSITGAQGNLNANDALTYLDLSGNTLTTIGSIAGIALSNATGSGNLTALYLSCNRQFECTTLNTEDGSRYPAAQTSTCTKLDPIKQTWSYVPNPQCGN